MLQYSCIRRPPSLQDGLVRHEEPIHSVFGSICGEAHRDSFRSVVLVGEDGSTYADRTVVGGWVVPGERAGRVLVVALDFDAGAEVVGAGDVEAGEGDEGGRGRGGWGCGGAEDDAGADNGG